MTRRPRLPEKSDFPSINRLSIVPPQGNSALTSVLLLLHGLGDTEVPFMKLAQSLSLPATVGIAIRAPSLIPPLLTGLEAPAFHWSDDLLFNEHNFNMDSDGGFSRAISSLEEIVLNLQHRCGFEERDILILGFGQGASVGLGFIAKMEREEKPVSGFGGIVAIGGGLPKETLYWIPDTPSAKLKTPLLICGGNSKTNVTQEVISTLKARFADMRYVKWEKKGDEMPKNRQEMLPIMEFFARRIRSRAGVPHDAVEI
ncbi:putative hydrolase C9G1.08c [Golovinomyces cichoracearum]|uniref:Putative hydrolase C9G1.08c n=1 Tax=Golovinomyces cichoracearum TaxID=62708 RepID=A0A420J0Y7_9PEZI|nr:putative hydrolase C9G1.08c [Golovinomyces cichoracearum]